MDLSKFNRIPSFRLRTLFSAIVVLCLLLGMITRDARRQKATVEWVKKSAPNNVDPVDYAHELVYGGRHADWVPPPGPAWLRNLIGIDYFGTVASVQLVGSHATDYWRLANFPELTQLFIGESKIDDLSPLAELRKLRVLNMVGTQVTDISPLANLTNLESLYLSNTPIRDYQALEGMKKLTILDLNGTRGTDLSPLRNMTAMERLSLSNTSVSDISALAGMKYLERLDLENTCVTDLSPLEHLTRLTHLYLNGTPVSDLSPIRHLQRLQVCGLLDTKVTDLSPLEDIAVLMVLGVTRSDIMHREIARFRTQRPRCRIDELQPDEWRTRKESR